MNWQAFLTSEKNNRPPRTLWLVVAILLTVHFLLATTSTTHISATFDEPVHLTGGYTYWTESSYRINPESGVFPQRLAALPLLFDSSIVNQKIPLSERHEIQQWRDAAKWLYYSGNNAHSMFGRGRMMIALVSTCLALLVFWYSSRLFGLTGGLISLVLYTLSPTVLANARLVTADMTVSAMFLAALWTLARTYRRITPLNVILSGLALGLLATSKYSCVLVIPTVAVLSLVKIFSRNNLKFFAGRFRITTNKITGKATILFATHLVQLAIVLVVIWASYSFRFDMVGPDQPVARELCNRDWQLFMQEPTPTKEAIQVMKHAKLLPEAYLYGALYTKSCIAGRTSFMRGRFTSKGWYSFFPFALAVKTPPSTIIMLAIACLAAVFLIRTHYQKLRQKSWRNKVLLLKLNWAAPILLFTAIYLAISILSRMNIGIRHLLPVYAPVFILTGISAYWLRKAMTKALIAFALLGLWLTIETFTIWPYYLTYFNAFAGGPRNGYKLLVDSSLDWGQGLVALRNYLDKRPEEQKRKDSYISYFGTSSLDYYQVGSHRLPCFTHQTQDQFFLLGPGLYCISATQLQSVHDLKLATWRPELESEMKQIQKRLSPLFKQYPQGGPMKVLRGFGGNELESSYRRYELLRKAKLCFYLRMVEPTDIVANSILVYELDAESLQSIGVE